MTFSEFTREKAQEIIARYPEGRQRSALLPLLHLVQADKGHICAEGVAFCADLLGLTQAEVSAVSTFYTMYKRKPTGEWLVSVCTNSMCASKGGEAAYQALVNYLGVEHGETTEDGKITLEHAECLAACDYAPVMTVNYEYFDNITPDSAVSLVKRLHTDDIPTPSRGAHLCRFKEMSIQLAGFADEGHEAVSEGVAGDPTLAGSRLAERHGVCVPGFDPETPIPSRNKGAVS